MVLDVLGMMDTFENWMRSYALLRQNALLISGDS